MTDLDDPFTQPNDGVHLTDNKRYSAPCPCAGGERRLHTRVTTFVKALADNIALERHAVRTTIEGLAADETLYLAVCAVMQRYQVARETNDTKGIKKGKEELDLLAYRARERAGALEGATRGTAFHGFSEHEDTYGSRRFVPSWIEPKIDAYAKALADAQLQVLPEYVERKVHCGRRELIGTLDRLYLDERTGLYIVGDLKSAREIWTGADWAIQLGEYANAEHIWNSHSQEWEPMPAPIDRTKAVIVWMPLVHPEYPETGHGVTIEEIRIDGAYERASVTAADARAWRNEGKTLISRRP